MSTIKIQHKKKNDKGFFYIGTEESILAELVYVLAPPKMIIEHTEVSDELRGQNIGLKLVMAAVEYARKEKLKIVPQCPFAHEIFKKRTDLDDVRYIKT